MTTCVWSGPSTPAVTRHLASIGIMQRHQWLLFKTNHLLPILLFNFQTCRKFGWPIYKTWVIHQPHISQHFCFCSWFVKHIYVHINTSQRAISPTKDCYDTICVLCLVFKYFGRFSFMTAAFIWGVLCTFCILAPPCHYTVHLMWHMGRWWSLVTSHSAISQDNGLMLGWNAINSANFGSTCINDIVCDITITRNVL